MNRGEFLSGASGTRGGRRALAHSLADRGITLLSLLQRVGKTLDTLAEETPPQRILVLGIYAADSPLTPECPALNSRQHDVQIALGARGSVKPSLAALTVQDDLSGGKFENLNEILKRSEDVAGYDWIVVVDDDVQFPPAFLDRFIAIATHFAFDLVQPAQSRRSHAAWPITRVRPACFARTTRFVEIGPVTAFSRAAATKLLPFPPLRYGWGLDLHWAAVAQQHGWHLGIVDAVVVRHEIRPVSASYDGLAAQQEAESFLRSHRWLPAWRATQPVTVHRSLSSTRGRA
jgi:hypothetical protein